ARGEKGSAPPGKDAPSWWAKFKKKTLFTLRHLSKTYLAHSLHKCLARENYDLYHEPNTIPLPCELPTLATLLDLSVLLHPEWHRAGRFFYVDKIFSLPLVLSLFFLAFSDFTRQEAIRVLNLPPERVTRTYMGIHRGLKPFSPERTARRLRRLGLPSQ